MHKETGREPVREPAMAGPSAVGLSKRGFDGVREAAMAELAASLPAPHSFGRRGASSDLIAATISERSPRS